MSFGRYSFTSKIAGKRFATSRANYRIFQACERGNLKVKTHIIKEGQRLDHMAQISYRDSTLWWVIAAASGIGWGLQVPPGTLIRIPIDINKIYGLIR